ncbi:hypothetical protein BDV28DRAFT_126478, partial [Aspergillus coremiiformis]
MPLQSKDRKSSLEFLITSRPYNQIGRGALLPAIDLNGENEAEVERITKEINL